MACLDPHAFSGLKSNTILLKILRMTEGDGHGERGIPSNTQVEGNRVKTNLTTGINKDIL